MLLLIPLLKNVCVTRNLHRATLLSHGGFVRFVLNKLHKFILKNKFPVSPSAKWYYHILHVLSSKRKPCWSLHSMTWNQPWKQPFYTLQSKTLLTTTSPLYPAITWNSSALNQSPTMLKKADEPLYSAGAFLNFILLINFKCNISPLSAVLFHLTLSISWNNLCKLYTDPAIKQGQVCGWFLEAVLCPLGGKQSGNTDTSEIKG